MTARMRPLVPLIFLLGTVCWAQAQFQGDDPLSRAGQQFDAGRYDQAIATLQAGVSRAPGDARLYFLLARSQYEAEKFEDAVKSLERAVQLEPKNSVYHQWLGRAYGQRAKHANIFSRFGLAKDTVREFEKAVELDPSNHQARRDLITFYLKAPGFVGGGDDKALRQIEKLEKVDPVHGHLARAEYWLEKDQPDKARAQYEMVLQVSSGKLEPYLEVADYYRQQRDAAGVEKAVAAAAKVVPGSPLLDYYRAVGNILAGQRLAEAEKLLQRYLQNVPKRREYPSHASAREYLKQAQERLQEAGDGSD